MCRSLSVRRTQGDDRIRALLGTPRACSHVSSPVLPVAPRQARSHPSSRPAPHQGQALRVALRSVALRCAPALTRPRPSCAVRVASLRGADRTDQEAQTRHPPTRSGHVWTRATSDGRATNGDRACDPESRHRRIALGIVLCRPGVARAPAGILRQRHRHDLRSVRCSPVPAAPEHSGQRGRRRGWLLSLSGHCAPVALPRRQRRRRPSSSARSWPARRTFSRAASRAERPPLVAASMRAMRSAVSGRPAPPPPRRAACRRASSARSALPSAAASAPRLAAPARAGWRG